MRSSTSTATTATNQQHPNDHDDIRTCLRKALSDSIASNDDETIRYEKFNSYNTAIPDTVENIVIVFGTVFIMSEARAEIGIIEPKDGDIIAIAGKEKDIYNYRDIQVCNDMICYDMVMYYVI